MKPASADRPAPSRTIWSVLLALLSWGLPAGDAWGQTKTWINPGTGSFSNSSNWSGGTPNQNTDAEISNGGIAQVLLSSASTRNLLLGRSAGSGELQVSGSRTLSSINVFIGESGVGRASVSGENSTWYTRDVVVGNLSIGTLDLIDGGEASTSGNVFIGSQAGSTGTVNLTGTGTAWLVTGAATLNVGSSGTGALNIEAGSLVSNITGYVGYFAGSTGTVNVDGSGSYWGNSKQLVIGVNGAGELNITDGGVVYSSADSSTVPVLVTQIGSNFNSSGAVTVDGAGSAWSIASHFVVGNGGAGELGIFDGGAVSNYNAYVGDDPGVEGVVTVDGAGSTWTSYNLYVGFYGIGTVDITNGGKVDDTTAYIGHEADSDGTVTVDGGSTWTNSSKLVVGRMGTGALDILGGSIVSNVFGYVGGELSSHTSADGTVIVNGAGSKWTNTNALRVGFAGAGALYVESGGAVSSTDGDIGSFVASSDGKVNIDGEGSKWEMSGFLDVGGTTTGGVGALTVQDGGRVSATMGATVWNKGTLSGDGTIAANVTNRGTVEPVTQSSPDPLNITGSFTQLSTGKLKFELAGEEEGYGQLDVTGNLSLAGTLQITLIEEFVPEVEQTFDLLTWGGTLTGTFATLQLPILDPGLGWDLSQLYTAGVLRVASSTTNGDFSGNNSVDGGDLALWRPGFGTTAGATRAQGDANGDQDVDGGDFLVWQKQLGGPPSTVSANAPVPEPATLLLAIVATAAIRRAGGRMRQELINA